MLLDDKEIIEKEIFLKIKDKSLINKNLLKLFKEKQKLTTEELNINDFIVTEYCSFNFLLELIDNDYEIDINTINSIFKHNKYNENKINILVKKIIKKYNDNTDKLSHNKMGAFIIKNENIDFTEDNLKDFRTNFSVVFTNIFLSCHKNIDFILKEKDLTKEQYNYLLKNQNYFDLSNVKKFLKENTELKQENNPRGKTYLSFKDKFENNIDEEILEDWLKFIPLDNEILDKYKDLFTENIIIQNPNLTEEMIKNYINVKTNNLNNLNYNIELSKNFIKQQLKEDIAKINPQKVFQKLKTEKDCEEMVLFYIDNLIKNKKYKENGEDSTIFLLLKIMNQFFSFDFNVYDKIIDKLKTKENIPEINNFELSLNQKLELFNKNTSEKYFNKVFNVEEFKDLNDEKMKILILNEDFINKIFKLIETTNIPEKILIKHSKLFTISNNENRSLNEFKINDFEKLISYQKIPDKLKTKDFYDNLTMSKIMSYIEQIETKEESIKIFEKIKELDKKQKHWFEDESFYRFLFNNSKYLTTLPLSEAIDLFKKSNIARSVNNYKLLSGLITLNEEKILEQKIFIKNDKNYGLSLF